jgi:NAD(P)-dependent dehydrogenase (short-subunit alcohol dehydrogenase family)
MKKPSDLKDKICIVTGANSGIGKATALALAKLDATVLMACRSKERGRAALEEIRGKCNNSKVELIQVDMASQNSIRNFVEEFKSHYLHLHVLINNAANFDQKVRQAILTEDGLETVFATNHLGPFLLTNLLLDRLTSSAPARIINVASKGMIFFPNMKIKFDDLNSTKRFHPQQAYYHSKLAHLMFTYDLAERLNNTGVTANCIRVTNVALDAERYEHLPPYLKYAYKLKRKMSITPENMAETYVYLAASQEVEGVTGKYFDENKAQVGSSKHSLDKASWKRLWDVSSRLVHLEEHHAELIGDN